MPVDPGDVGAAGGPTHATSQLGETDVGDLSGKQVHRRVDELSATQHGGVERTDEVSDTARDV